MTSTKRDKPTADQTYYCGKRLSDMSRDELIESVLDLSERAKSQHDQRMASMDKITNLIRSRVTLT